MALLLLALAACAASPRPLQFVSGPDPVYPAAAREAGVQGYVTVRYDVSAEGAVVNLRVLEAAPVGTFEAAVLEAVGQWRFRPPVLGGDATAVRDRVSTLEFRLGESDAYAGH